MYAFTKNQTINQTLETKRNFSHLVKQILPSTISERGVL